MLRGKDLFIQTLNCKGFECKNVNPLVEECIKDAVNQNKLWSLEIGAGFGTNASVIVSAGVKLYCNDLEKKHLDHIKKSLGGVNNIHYLSDDFLALQFEEKSLHSIFSSRVIHFLTPPELEKAFQLFHKWLKPNGKLFLSVETPFLGNWKKFIPEFEKRKKERDNYPGFISDPKKWEDSGFASALPPCVHWFDKESLTDVATRNDFSPLTLSYINRKNDFPEALLHNGNESINGVFIKVN